MFKKMILIPALVVVFSAHGQTPVRPLGMMTTSKQFTFKLAGVEAHGLQPSVSKARLVCYLLQNEMFGEMGVNSLHVHGTSSLELPVVPHGLAGVGVSSGPVEIGVNVGEGATSTNAANAGPGDVHAWACRLELFANNQWRYAATGNHPDCANVGDNPARDWFCAKRGSANTFLQKGSL